MDSFSLRLFRLQERLGIKNKSELAQMLGISRTTLYNYEQGEPPPPESILTKVHELEDDALIEREQMSREQTGEYNVPTKGGRRVKIISWAHAGLAESYEELPDDWQKDVPTDCPDPLAFGLTINGESMEPDVCDGDEVIVTPSTPLQSGQLTVAKMANDGIILRKIQILQNDLIRMIPSNKDYAKEDFRRNEIQWIYPVYGSFRHWCK